MLFRRNSAFLFQPAMQGPISSYRLDRVRSPEALARMITAPQPPNFDMLPRATREANEDIRQESALSPLGPPVLPA
jgi:hypothetical protein